MIFLTKLLIKLYQFLFSFDHSFWAKNNLSIRRRCIFTPSCSQYTLEALDKCGFFKGLWLGFKRVIRCHPWGKGGEDYP
jgi:uncharacterized protein